jgi:hypothetical protein
MIENKELKFAAVGALILYLWFSIFKDMLAPYLLSMPAYIATLIYHLGFYLGIYFLSNILYSDKSKRLKFSLVAISILIGIDIVDSPYLLSHGVINTSIEYWNTTYDAAFASLLQNIFRGDILQFMVYRTIPFILIFIIPIIISNPKKIKEYLGF